MNIILPSQVETVISALEKNGFEAYIVGGCVRDSIIKKTPPDWDITTNALPNEVLAVFKDFKTIQTGLKHGTITVVVDSMSLEITTFRVDGDYLDNRHPEKVKFCTTIKEDLNRRDFTMNSMAYNNRFGLIDPFGGKNDIENKIIRCVGNADLRFSEDALRILRALRFSSVLGFELEKSTCDSIHKNAHLLQNISKERVASELLKILCGDNVYDVLINYRDVFAIIIPQIEPMFDFEQHNKHHIFDVWEHTVVAIDFAKKDPIIRLSLLLHDIGKPSCFTKGDDGIGHFYGHANASVAISEDILNNLKFSNDIKSTVLTLVKYHDYHISPDKKTVKKRLAKLSEPMLRQLLEVKLADSLAQNPDFSNFKQNYFKIHSIIDDIIKSDECFKICDLAINGNDLIALGIPKGKKIGKILNQLLSDVIDGSLENNKKSLVDSVKNGGLNYE